MPILSSNPMWESFGLRALPLALYGGADTGECVTTVARVGDGGSADDWHREWKATADRISAIGEECERREHWVSMREAYFRAATYHRVSYLPLFGSPVDQRLKEAFVSEEQVFLRAAEWSDPAIEAVEIPFEGTTLPGYFVHTDWTEKPRPTIIHTNGYDSNIQEMYFAHGPAATRRGYNCLLFDGPGQGRNLIEDGRTMRPDWETVVKAAVDYALTRQEVDAKKLVLCGWSFGGLLAPRAAAFEKRIAALIADPGQWDLKDSLKALPVDAKVLADLDNADPAAFEPFEHWLRSPKADPITRWKIIQRGMWVHGAANLYELAREMSRFEVSSVAGEISCPTLLTIMEGDAVAASAQTLYDALRCKKTLVRFNDAEGAGGHCEGLGRALYHQRVFDWLDETLA